jgi:hypothetical protein
LGIDQRVLSHEDDAALYHQMSVSVLDLLLGWGPFWVGPQELGLSVFLRKGLHPGLRLSAPEQQGMWGERRSSDLNKSSNRTRQTLFTDAMHIRPTKF